MITVDQKRHEVRQRLVEENEFPNIPENWSIERLRFLFSESKERNGKVPVGEMLSVSEYHGVIPREYEHEEQKRTEEELENYRVVRPGQLAVNSMWLNHLGLGVSDHIGHVSPAYNVYDLSYRLDRRFAHHLMRSNYYLKIYLRYLYGIRPNSFQIKSNDWASIPIIVPDLPTQRAIADFLDRETVRIDSLIEKKQRLVELVGEKVRSDIHGLFKSLDARTWRIRHLGKVKNGAGFPVDLQGDASNETPFFKVKHLAVNGLDQRIIDSEDTITEETVKTLRATVFPEGTIVFAKIGAALLLGRFSMLGIKGCIDNNLAAFVANKRLADPDYLLLCFERFEMQLMAQPGAVPSLSTERFINQSVPLPTLDGQRELVGQVRKTVQRNERVVQRTQDSIDRLKEYRSALITSAVTGQIDVSTYARSGTKDRHLDAIQLEMQG